MQNTSIPVISSFNTRVKIICSSNALLPEVNFLYCPIFFVLTKNLHTAHTPTEIRQDLLH